MKKVMLLFCLFSFIFFGCASNERNMDIENLLLNNNYNVVASESSVEIKRLYSNGNEEGWVYNENVKNKLCYRNYAVLENNSIDIINGEFIKNNDSCKYKIEEKEIKYAKKLNEEKLKELNISSSDLEEYMKYKLTAGDYSEERDPKIIEDCNIPSEANRVVKNFIKHGILDDFHWMSKDNDCVLGFKMLSDKKETGINGFIFYDPYKNEFKGLGIQSSGKINIEPEMLIVECAKIIECIDENIKKHEAIVIVTECYNKPCEVNNYQYLLEFTDEGEFQFMILNKKSFND